MGEVTVQSLTPSPAVTQGVSLRISESQAEEDKVLTTKTGAGLKPRPEVHRKGGEAARRRSGG